MDMARKVLSIMLKVMAVCSFVMTAIGLLVCLTDTFGNGNFEVTVIFLVIGLGLWILGTKVMGEKGNIKINKRVNYKKLIGDNEVTDLNRIVDTTGKSYDEVKNDIQNLQKKGLWSEYYIDDELKMLIKSTKNTEASEVPEPKAEDAFTEEEKANIVICPCCGAENRLIGETGVCEYCGAALEMPKPEVEEAAAAPEMEGSATSGTTNQPVAAKAQPAQIIIQRGKQTSGAFCDFDVYLMNQYLGILKTGTELAVNVDAVGTFLLTFKPRKGGLMGNLMSASVEESCFSVVVNEPGEIIKVKTKFDYSGHFVAQYADNLPHVPTYNL